ncbi:cell envelope integrity protein CreD [Solilutibacter silvestris]|uniref:Inner membrane protein involved in colicin E2 resistance n=1 Tax=Solilutibacter silvestris TaxID=1645665 RepID=A0A2K1Q409_9GAMM|nr:cell envelope integrity protein CreD [Lysobacter silvestris]PNS09786.1 Inner membrane protein involved in colicin E2 resistance [Lysobacter silvestris]
MHLFFKAAIVFVLTLAIVIPLTLIHGIVRDRQSYRAQAVADVAQNVGGVQTFAGPVLVVPYVETRTIVSDEEGKPIGKVERTPGRWVFYPEDLRISGNLPTDVRTRGIHVVPVYQWDGDVAASFEATIPDNDPGTRRDIGEPWLSWEFSDPRGLQGTPALTVNGAALKLQPGAGFREGNGMHVRLQTPTAGTAIKLQTQLAIHLAGTQTFSFLPIGRDNRIDLSSDWAAPKFVGASPRREASGKGFIAHWRVSSLAANSRSGFPGERAISQRGALPEAATVEQELPGRISIGLVDPVNAYSSIDRAIKYGLLFVAVTFAGFFLIEFLKRVPIHPIQYGLVGLAIAIFFLLLLSLSEHFTFGVSYLAAAAACIGLIGFYLVAVLRGLWRGLAFTGLLTTLYGVLYGVLISEDNALVLGSGLLFLLLAAIMVATRRVDWYAISASRGRRAPQASGNDGAML